MSKVGTGELQSTSLKLKYLHIIWNSSAWENNSSILSILFIQLFISAWIQGYLLYILGYNKKVIYFAAQIVSGLAIENNFSQFWHPFDMPLLMLYFIFCLFEF